MADEFIAFTGPLDQSWTLGVEMHDLLNRYLPIHIYTDSKPLSDMI